MSHEAPTSASRSPLRRRVSGRLLAGVCAGVADGLGVNLGIVRVMFALLATNGVGLVGYFAIWLLVRDDAPEGDRGLPLRRPRDLVRAINRDRPGEAAHRRSHLIGYLLLGLAAGGAFSALGLGFGRQSTLPLSIAAVGALLIWWRTPESRRDQWSQDARRYGSRLTRRGPSLVVLGGVGLVVVGVASFLAANDAWRQARDGALAIGATLVGVLLITGPWLARLVRDLGSERRARIREQERAEMAAHLHDSVLQTLALIQARSTDADGVRRLARRQERELRGWLYETQDPTAATLALALRAAAAEVEDSHGVPIDVVVVGDAPLDEPLVAVAAAAREGMVNAAKSSGSPSVAVFAEVTDKAVDVYVRDRGRGFDPDQVPPDRRGIRDSIVARMARWGGDATVKSGPAGTEVALHVGHRSKSIAASRSGQP